jgi:hypothetical protein
MSLSLNQSYRYMAQNRRRQGNVDAILGSPLVSSLKGETDPNESLRLNILKRTSKARNQYPLLEPVS